MIEQIIERLKKILAEDTEDNTYTGRCKTSGCDDFGDLLDYFVDFRSKLIDLIHEFES